MKEVLFVLLNEFADWEAAPLAAAVNESDGFCVKTVSGHKQPVRSIGGFSVNPDYDWKEAAKADFAGLVLVGGKAWRSETAGGVVDLIEKALLHGAVVGAICDASAYLASLGLLNKIGHTGNTLEEMKNFAGKKYTGEAYYKAQQAVRDGCFITANGSAGLEFAREFLLALGAMPAEAAESWYRFYKFGYYGTAEKSPAI